MLAQIQAAIRSMGQTEFIIAAVVAVVVMGIGFYLWKRSFQHARVMEDTPTSKVRSAAQGFVELVGTQHGLGGQPLKAPLTGSDCTWWSYHIEKQQKRRDSKGRQTTHWVTVEKDTSVGFFILRDMTGEAMVNPKGAEITASLKRTWRGNSRRPGGAPTGGFLSGGFGRYRYTERIMRPSEPIYALGHFETWSNVTGSSERNERRAKILADWKQNPAELVERFDADGDGEIDVDEWEAARAAAEALVEEHVAKAAAQPEVDILMKPEDDHPFILSTKSQDELVRAYRWKASAGLVLFIIGTVGLGLLLTTGYEG
jgi:hypothetical protein